MATWQDAARLLKQIDTMSEQELIDLFGQEEAFAIILERGLEPPQSG